MLNLKCGNEGESLKVVYIEGNCLLFDFFFGLQSGNDLRTIANHFQFFLEYLAVWHSHTHTCCERQVHTLITCVCWLPLPLALYCFLSLPPRCFIRHSMCLQNIKTTRSSSSGKGKGSNSSSSQHWRRNFCLCHCQVALKVFSNTHIRLAPWGRTLSAFVLSTLSFSLVPFRDFCFGTKYFLLYWTFTFNLTFWPATALIPLLI